MITALDNAIKKALSELREYHKATDSSGGKAKIKLDITLAKETDQFYGVSYSTKVESPGVQRTSMVKEAQGRLICQPTGASERDSDDPDQMLIFDSTGKIIGDLNKDTGELVPAVAGKIKQA
jgi:hypothetical protein